MRIATRLTLAVSTAGLALFGTHGAWQLWRESADLNAAAVAGATLVAHSVQVAAENALRDQQIDDIRETMDRLEHISPDTDVLIYDPMARLVANSPGSDPYDPDARDPVARALVDRETHAVRNTITSPDRLIVALPLESDDGRLIGAMAIVRPLGDVERTYQEAAERIVLTAVVMFLVTSALGFTLGRIYVGRPLASMVTAMRRVREGDLSSALAVDRQDELGLVATEFNMMVGELRHTRLLLQEEAENRRRLQRGIQDADKLITLGQLAAGLAHEIGSPLQILGGRARSLMAKAGDRDETIRNAEILVEQVDRITGIVEQLLRFARRRPPTLQRVDITKPVQAVLDLLSIEGRRRGLRIEMVRDPDVPDIQVDPDQVQQIVLNLLTNAMYATPSGGRILVSLSRFEHETGPGARITIVDSGSGMTAEVLEQLFEPFFTTRAQHGGTGLGLSVVHALVSEHHGHVRAESTLGHGSRFTVELPGGTR